jgi:hypothetical protein
MIDDGDCGGIDGMKIGRGNGSTRKIYLSQCHFVHYKSHMTRPGLEKYILRFAFCVDGVVGIPRTIGRSIYAEAFQFTSERNCNYKDCPIK